MAIENDPLLTLAEVLEVLGVTRSSLDRWRRVGKGPVTIRLPNGKLRFRQCDLNEWVESLSVEDREVARSREIQQLFIKDKKIPLRLYGPPIRGYR